MTTPAIRSILPHTHSSIAKHSAEREGTTNPTSATDGATVNTNRRTGRGAEDGAGAGAGATMMIRLHHMSGNAC
ncbi:hypothetical protein V1264_019305 [Littorina saxatilis]|uniref:Uncharacterized protein n=1 Tax=Littorina saxatilis TaxID=31220 RepID=A0AAN9GEE2_9CAEN